MKEKIRAIVAAVRRMDNANRNLDRAQRLRSGMLGDYDCPLTEEAIEERLARLKQRGASGQDIYQSDILDLARTIHARYRVNGTILRNEQEATLAEAHLDVLSGEVLE